MISWAPIYKKKPRINIRMRFVIHLFLNSLPTQAGLVFRRSKVSPKSGMKKAPITA